MALEALLPRAVPPVMPAAPERPSGEELWRPTPLAGLQLAEIPTDLHFVRDHFPAPTIHAAAWTAELRGETTLMLNADLLRAFPKRTLRVVLECAGHRRVEFRPIPPGVPWACGAISEARWTGASLAALLRLAGIPADAREVVLEGADAGPVAGFDGIHRFARSLPLTKALEADVLLAYEMNGEPIRVDRGGPVRAIVPGWYATDSVKWLKRIWITSREFDGVFQAHDYRLQVPGDPGRGRRMTELPVQALITTPENGKEGPAEPGVQVRGIAWGGTGGVAHVLVRVDRGPWARAQLGPSQGEYSRIRWETHCTLAPGPHEITCRAIDEAGCPQPVRPMPNVHGYANNAIHRVHFKAV